MPRKLRERLRSFVHMLEAWIPQEPTPLRGSQCRAPVGRRAEEADESVAGWRGTANEFDSVDIGGDGGGA